MAEVSSRNFEVTISSEGVAGPPGPVGPAGPQGPKGDTGDGLTVSGSSTSMENDSIYVTSEGYTEISSSLVVIAADTIGLGSDNMIFATSGQGVTVDDVRHNMSGTGFPEGVVTAPVGSKYTDKAATNGAIEWIKASGTGNTGWRVVYGDTGWRNVESIFQDICTANSLTYANSAGFTAPKIRRVNQELHINVGVVITGTTIANANFGPAFGQNINGWRGGPSNRQIPASVLGTAGVVHWAQSIYVRFWTAGTQQINLVWPITDTVWPSTLPGTAV